jgi:precorrin-2 C20-methyltransferase/precorrin-3B C17-methyltransferase
VYVERASCDAERIAPIGEVDPGSVPYMSLVLVPTSSTAPAVQAQPSARNGRGRGRVTVVGLGPAGAEWLTPEAGAALAAADELVGYAPYVARVPQRAGQRRHCSDNRVEAQRARHALELAAGGARVAVVSSGDPGIFAMAAAVLEALHEGDDAVADVDVRVVPGLSAMQAAAARVGAPLGHDFCVLSSSAAWTPPVPPTSFSRSTTPRRGRAGSSSPARSRSSPATGRRRRRSSSPARSARPTRR